MKTLQDQIAAAKRELALRRRVYPTWVKDEKKSQTDATHEIECMEAICATLQKLIWLKEMGDEWLGTSA